MILNASLDLSTNESQRVSHEERDGLEKGKMDSQTQHKGSGPDLCSKLPKSF